MDEKLGSFLSSFSELVTLAQQQSPSIENGDALLRTLTEFLGQPPEQLPVILESVPGHRMADLDIALESITARDPQNQLLGIGGGEQRNHSTFSELIQISKTYHQFPLAQPDFSNLAVGPDEQRKIVSFGLRLFTFDGLPLVILQRDANPRFGREQATVEVLTPSSHASAAFLSELRSHLASQSVYKGQVISFTMSEYGPHMGGVSFVRRPVLEASEVILPSGVLRRVEDHTLGIGQHAAALRASGQHLKRGILLYGPPGTGKTHTVRYLLSKAEGTTAVLLSGTSLARVTEATALARALAPSIVVLEDCDLIAEDRSFSMGPQPLLFEVLDAMDGLDADADVSFVLTTNRVDTLERALAQRPCRVDLAIEVPVPSEPERLDLLRLYSKRLPFGEDALAQAAALTSGTTASFAKELIRRAVLAATLNCEPLTDSHLLSAVEQLMSDDESLTRSLLGSKVDGSEGDNGEQADGPAHGGTVSFGSYSNFPLGGTHFDE